MTKKLDITITLYKRKLDGLKELKKAYLQQMFPQAGETVPRLRFEGFAENWRVVPETNSFVPKIEEQAAIGRFFANIDTQITAQAQKLEQLTQLKSVYLQKMFV